MSESISTLKTGKLDISTTTVNTTPITTFSRCPLVIKVLDCEQRGNMTGTSDKRNSCEQKQPSRSDCCFMEIRVKGQLGSEWSDWFENMDLSLLENGEMILSGAISDQAALMGILNKLNRLNLTLLSVNEVSKKK